MLQLITVYNTVSTAVPMAGVKNVDYQDYHYWVGLVCVAIDLICISVFPV